MNYSEEVKFNKLINNIRKEYKDIIIDFIIVDKKSKNIFIQRRMHDRELFPGEWEFPGGILEQDEALVNCIKRHLYDECKMQLDRIIDLVYLFSWSNNQEVATVQFLIEADGDYNPRKDKISTYRLISRDELEIIKENKETPIYRGAYYAFQYLEAKEKNFDTILFYDKLLADFFSFLKLKSEPPLVCIDGDKKFFYEKSQNEFKISTQFLGQYDKFSRANIILHQIFHNYCQNILKFDNVTSIRTLLGKNFMFYIDIVADVYTFKFLNKNYNFSKDDYTKICYESIREYQADKLEDSKLPRLLGTLLTLENHTANSFNVILPALDEARKRLVLLQFDNSVQYQELFLDNETVDLLRRFFTNDACNYSTFVKTIKNIIDLQP